MGILGNLNSTMGRIGAGLSARVPQMRAGMSSGAAMTRNVGRIGQGYMQRGATRVGLNNSSTRNKVIGYGATAAAGGLGYGAYRTSRGRRKSKPAY
jgi:hypothetical protein